MLYSNILYGVIVYTSAKLREASALTLFQVQLFHELMAPWHFSFAGLRVGSFGLRFRA